MHDTIATTVLVIDDDRVIRMVVRDALESAGYAVLEAEDAESGIALAVDRSPDVVILDVMLPRVDGLAVLSDLVARGVRARVLVFSASGARNAERAMSLGAAGYLQKPFEIAELLRRVAELVERGSAAA